MLQVMSDFAILCHHSKNASLNGAACQMFALPNFLRADADANQLPSLSSETEAYLRPGTLVQNATVNLKNTQNHNSQ